jgi:hypothetical protein
LDDSLNNTIYFVQANSKLCNKCHNCFSDLIIAFAIKIALYFQYGNCLHQDGTSKFHRHFQSFQVTTAEKRTYSIGLTEVGARDTVTLMEAFKTQVEELS